MRQSLYWILFLFKLIRKVMIEITIIEIINWKIEVTPEINARFNNFKIETHGSALCVVISIKLSLEIIRWRLLRFQGAKTPLQFLSLENLHFYLRDGDNLTMVSGWLGNITSLVRHATFSFIKILDGGSRKGHAMNYDYSREQKVFSQYLLAFKMK